MLAAMLVCSGLIAINALSNGIAPLNPARDTLQNSTKRLIAHS